MSITLDTPLTAFEAFCTIAEADSYLEDDSIWQDTADESKNAALLKARYYMEGKFSCTIEGGIPDELKYSNTLLASDYVKSPTSFESAQNVKKKRVKAGSVESEIENLGGGSKSPASWKIVKSIMQSYCPSTGAIFIIRA